MKFLTQQGILIELDNSLFDSNPGIIMSFQKLLIVRNIAFGAPQGLLVLRTSSFDTGKLNYWFSDGLEMDLNIEDSLNNTHFKTQIVIFGTPVVESINPGLEEGNEKTILKISFVFKSSYNFLLQITRQNCYSGTLTSILNQIAEELNISLNINITDSSSNLNWISYGKNYKNFLETILKYQRISSDVLLYFLDMDGVLNIKQVGKTLLETPKKIIKSSPINLDLKTEKLNEISCENEVYYSNKIRSKNYAGILNNITGKNNIIKNCSVVSKDFEQNKISFLRANITTELNKNQNNTLMFYGAVNTNEYDINDSIYYENLRKRCLFSNEIEANIEGTKASKIKLLDEVLLNLDDKNKQMYNGNYLVISKTIEIDFNNYAEKLVLINYGKNYQGLADNL